VTDPRPIADGWYAWMLGGVEWLDRRLERGPRALRALARRRGAVRGALLFAESVRRPGVVVLRADPGWRTLLALRALLGRRRKLVALHFIVHPRRASGRGRLIDAAWDPVDRWATRRALLRGQVLSGFEVDAYARRYGLERSRFAHVPFAWRWSEEAEPLGELPRGGPVVAAGRAFCDWPTLFAAAEGADWPLVAVCSPEDRAEVEALNARGRAQVLTGLTSEQARALLRTASACAIVMHEAAISQGHVRLADAVEVGAPVVATSTSSLEGYALDGETALLVPPGDATALRTALDRALGDPDLALRLRSAAFRRAGDRPFGQYVSCLESLVPTKK